MKEGLRYQTQRNDEENKGAWEERKEGRNKTNK